MMFKEVATKVPFTFEVSTEEELACLRNALSMARAGLLMDARKMCETGADVNAQVCYRMAHVTLGLINKACMGVEE